MFNYTTYNGIPIITYGLIGLTASILGLVTLNPYILELKEDGTQTTVAESIGLDKIRMPELPSYLPGLNGLPQPFTSDEPKDKPIQEVEPEDKDKPYPEDEEEEEEEEEEPEKEQSNVMTPLRKPSGGRKTRNKRKNKRKTKRKK